MKKRHEHQLKRQDQINAGAYDGRYKVKVVPNKKKEIIQRRCSRALLKKYQTILLQGWFFFEV